MAQQNQKLIKLVIDRQSSLENDKTNFNDRLQDVADFVCPHRDDILGTMQPGEKKGSKIFDGTAVSAAVLATDGIHGYHVSPAFPWFKYVMNRKEVNKIPEVRTWLQEIEHNMYMALNRSNFYSSMWSYIYDGYTLGTAPIYAEEDIADGRIVFESVHPGEAFIAENKYAEIDLMHRKRKISARKLVQMFGLENMTPNVKQAYENNPFTEFETIQAVFPREEFDERMKDAKNKRFASVWLLSAGNHVMRESGFDLFPYHVWRYMKSGKEPYGYSPAHLAMADIKGLNLMSKTLLGAAQLAVDPAYNVPAYLKGKTQLRPRGINYVKDPQDKISVINNGQGFPVGIDREQAKQQAIEKRFHVDTFLMLASLDGRGQRTAYEVSEMMAEKAAILGAELGPLNTQIDSVLDSVYKIEVNANRMPIPPDIIQELAEQDGQLRFDPIYQGPLAQAQREKFGKDSIRKFFMDLAPLYELQPNVIDNYDIDKASLVLADVNGIPEEIKRPKDEVKKIRKGAAAAQQQEQQMEDAQGVIQGLKTASEADANMGGALSQAMGEGLVQ